MATLRADENRYLVQASPRERASIARIPGGRGAPGGLHWQLPRQAGVILALDRVLGKGGWAADGDLAQEIAEARGRIYSMPESRAVVHLEGGLLSVECTIADKELVKRVPGYRWSPAHKRWYLAAVPLSLEILRDGFRDQLAVDGEAIELMDLRRIDEQREAERAQRASEETDRRALAMPGQAPVPAPESTAGAGYQALRQLAEEPMAARLEPLLERLAVAIESLVARVDGLAAGNARRSDVPAASSDAEVQAAVSGWREVLERSATNASEALQDARRRLQTAVGADPELRAAAGVAAARAGDPREAFRLLRKALETKGTIGDVDLESLASKTFEETVLQLLSTDCTPERPITSIEAMRAMLAAELTTDSGLQDDRRSAETLQVLVNDRALGWVSPALSDLVRVLHLLATARGGARMSADLVTSVLEEQALTPDAFALGCILYACVRQGTKCVADWLGSWPGEWSADDAGWLVEPAVRKIGAADRSVAGPAALAALACIAAGPADQATLAQRRSLVALTDETDRAYAEFLAVFRLAESGERVPLESFKGYTTFLSSAPLSQTASYLIGAYLTGEGVPGSAVRTLADYVFLAALRSEGITHEQELLPLLDLLAAGTKPDQLLNDVAEMVEDGDFTGAGLLDRAARIDIYRTAYEACLRSGHDRDAREAFYRLARALEQEPESDALRAFCQAAMASIKPVKLPGALTLLELQLAGSESFDETLERVLELAKSDPAGLDQIEGLQTAYPALADAVAALVQRKRGTAPQARPELPVTGRRVLIVGGHQRLKGHSVPALEKLGIKVDFLDSTESKTGTRVIDLVKGACEVVVVNTAYIGHAQSERAMSEAKKLGKPILTQPNNGLGSLLWAISNWFRNEAAPSDGKRSKVKELGKRMRR